MAQKTLVVLEDDLDGGPADETITFSLDGVAYEIDLNSDNARKMRDALAVFIGSARRAGPARAAGRSRGRAAGAGRAARGRDSRTAEIRAWAREQGLPVNERGRISADIVEKYDRAH